MKNHKKITVANVRASINYDVKTHPSITWFGRPLANLITPFFHNAGWTANRLTITRAYIAFVGVLLLVFPLPFLWQISASIFYLCFVLDCVDGNLARLQNDASYLGKYLDGLADSVYSLYAVFFLGIGTWRFYDEPGFLVAGSVISLISVSNQMIRYRLSFFREWMVGLTGQLTEEELQKAQNPRDVQASLATIMNTGSFLAFLFLVVPHWGGLLFFATCIITQFIPESIWILTSMAEAFVLLKRGRISKHARVTPSTG